MSGHAKAASADSEIHPERKRKADGKIYSERKRKEDEEIQSRSDDEQIHSERKRKADGKIHSERKRKEDDKIQSKTDDEDAKSRSESDEKSGSMSPASNIEQPEHSSDSEKLAKVAEALKGILMMNKQRISSKSKDPRVRITETSKGRMNKQRSSSNSKDQRNSERDDEQTAESLSESDDEQTAESLSERDDEMPYSDHTQHSAKEIIKALNDKERPRIWIPEKRWMDYIKGDPKDRDGFSSDVSIFKVQMFLKDIKREAYVPQRVSLGPYHEGRPDLPPMNHHKGRALRRMMIRRNKNMGIDPNNLDFASKARDVILELQYKIRPIYQEYIVCSGRTLARMVCWDGCFILEVLRTLGRDPKENNDPIFRRDPNIFGLDPNEKNDLNEKNDPIFGENKVAASNLLKDILMLENQIPCIILRELLRLEDPKDEHVERTLLKVLVEGTCGLFKFSEEDKSALMQCDWLTTVQPVHHLLGFLHKVIVHRPSNFQPIDQAENCIGHCLIMLQDTNKASNDIESIPHAVELKHAGIKFLPFKGGIKEIIFHRNSATIYLPSVSITYGTEVLFRNLIAFEICRPSEGSYVTWYVALMNDLIDSEEDVALLRSVGILTTLLGSDKEVADLFNGLCNEGTVRIENFFDDLRKDVNAHYKNKIRIQLAELVREHFSSPWKALALAAAFIILILTLIQTIFTIIK